MMQKKYRYLLIVVLLIGLTGINSLLMPQINTMRHDAGLTRNLPLENAPPQFVLAVNILGSLRCLLIDALWLRTMKLREEGKYFEMAQLYKWICQLEPQIEDVWTHNAWNMAYNISFEMPFAQDRWRWIKRAISLLRDEGLMYNTRSATIRKEIAWIYAHKIGQQWDDMHLYYKKQLALEMDPLVHGPDDIRLLSELPDFDTALAQDDTLNKLWELARKAGVSSYDSFLVWTDNAPVATETSGETVTLLDNLLRAKTLQDDYKLDLMKMAELQDTYGPLDWRLPESHAIYWASEGKQFAAQRHEILYDRLIYLSVQSLYRRGSLYLVDDGDDVLYITGPDDRFIDPMYTLYNQLVERYENEPAMTNILSSYRYFLQEVVVLLYAFDNREKAQEYFNILKKEFSEHTTEDDFITYVMHQFMITAQTGSFDHVKSLIFSLVRQAYWNLALGQDEQFTGYLRLAQTIRAEYLKSTGNQERLRLPRIETIQKQVVDNALSDDFPPSLQESLQKRIDQSKLSKPETKE